MSSKSCSREVSPIAVQFVLVDRGNSKRIGRRVLIRIRLNPTRNGLVVSPRIISMFGILLVSRVLNGMEV
jgi:hypothetical protein